MPHRSTRPLVLALFSLALGCGGPHSEDAGPPRDGGPRDSGAVIDAGAGLDAAAPDGSAPDDAGTSTECVDEDEDGYAVDCGEPRDCADDDGTIHPGAPEACDGVDNDCSGAADEGCACEDGATRACGSAIGACALGDQRCVAGTWGACEGQTDPVAERCDGAADDDCDTLVDEGCLCTDGASRPCGSDVGACEEGSQGCVAGAWGACVGGTGAATEVCEGVVDESCDGEVDEGCACVNGATRACGSDVGACVAGVETCAAGAWGACLGATGPTTERCDGTVDDNCDGAVDEGCDCTNGATRACGTDVGACVAGTQPCVTGSWAACMGEVTPATEVCDGTVDDNCDGAVDEGCECTNGATRACGTDVGACVAGTETCVTGSWAACMGEVTPATEVCDGSIDENCDGTVDEGCAPPSDPGATFGARALLSGPTEATDVAVADLNGDGRPEILLADYAGDRLVLLPNQSTPGALTGTSFGDPVFIAAGDGPSSVAVGDLDGDTRVDVVIVNETSGDAYVYLNAGATEVVTAASLADPIVVAVGASPFHAAVGDLDGDTRLDVAISRPGTPAQLTVLRNTSSVGALSFAAVAHFSGTYAARLHLADVNHDGLADVLLAHGGSHEGLSTFRNESSPGSLDLAHATGTVGPGCYGVFSPSASDFDDDGYPELIALGPRTCSSTSVLVVAGNQSTMGSFISFRRGIDLAADSQYGGQVAVSADMNRDGRDDIVGTIMYFGEAMVRVWTHRPDATAAVEVTDFEVGSRLSMHDAGGYYTPLAIGDLDADGWPDVVTASLVNGQVAVRRNTTGD